MNRFLQLFSILLLFVLPAQAQVIYNFTNATNGAYASLAPNLTATNLTTVGSWGSNTACAAGGGISGLTTAPTYTTYNPANASSPALNVNITPAPGYYIQVNSISVSMRRSSQGPAKARLAYSLDGGATWIDNGSDYVPNNAGCGNFSNYTWPLSTPAYLCSGTLKVRVYYYNSVASSGTCQTANLQITGAVGQPATPGLSISAAPAGPVCAGTNVVFTATPSNGGTTPVYTWYLNGGVVGTNSNTYNNNSLVATDVVTCAMAPNAPCVPATPVNSNNISISVLQPVTVHKKDTICAGSSYPFGTQTLTTSGAYNATFTGANTCDSIVNLSLYVRPAITNSVADTICNGGNYVWGGQSYNTTGTYNHTFTAATGCDSSVSLHLFVRPAISKSFADTACAGVTYTWGGQAYTATGTYNHTFTAANGCDSNVTLQLFIRPVITHNFADTVCAGVTYNWAGQAYTTTGNYNKAFTTAAGCDSTVTLHLFIRPAITHNFADTVCAGITYNWAGQTYTTTGNYNKAFTTAAGCDSTVTLHLFVKPTITHNFADTVCTGVAYNWAGQAYTTTGNYNKAFTTATGCDSTVTLHLFVKPTIAHNFADTVCTGVAYNWAGQTYTTTGNYNKAFTTATGCDSTVTLHLFIRPAIIHNFSDTACAGATYTWGGSGYTATGVYNHIFGAAHGCDSTVTLHLFVRPVQQNSITRQTCFGTGYAFGGQTFYTSGIYTHVFQDVHHCDSTVTLTLNVGAAITDTFSAAICAGTTYNWAGQAFTATGTYNHTFTAANGCDSMVTLHLTVKPVHTGTINVTRCYGESYLFGNQNLSLSGTYTHVFQNQGGCDSTVTLHLQISPQPAQVLIDTASCGTVWFEGISYTSPTTLIDTFITTGGCDSLYRTVHIMPHALPAIRQIDTTGCNAVVFEGRTYNSNTTLRDTLSAISGCDSLVRIINIRVHEAQLLQVTHEMCSGDQFRFNGQIYSAAGTYPLYYKSRAGCDSVVSLEIIVHPHPVLRIQAEQTGNHCIGDSVTLTAYGAQNYTWIYNEIETNTEGSFTAPLYRASNTITVLGTDINGCSNSTDISIEAQACCAIWMPNAFSPNGDGLNDIFKPETQGHPSEYILQIYNRWGATVFSSYDVGKGWDGTINGQPADIADYHYRISGKCVSGEPIRMTGTCTLVR